MVLFRLARNKQKLGLATINIPGLFSIKKSILLEHDAYLLPTPFGYGNCSIQLNRVGCVWVHGIIPLSWDTLLSIPEANSRAGCMPMHADWMSINRWNDVFCNCLITSRFKYFITCFSSGKMGCQDILKPISNRQSILQTTWGFRLSGFKHIGVLLRYRY